ncbi:MAG: hypothetical protein V3V55_01750, partial [Rhodospirillales bacterium]
MANRGVFRIERTGVVSLCVLFAAALLMAAAAGEAKPRHAMAMHGEPKYGPGFKHFDYANAEAP